MSRQPWVLLDGRAKAGEEDDAAVMDTADSEAEARREGETTWEGYDAIWLDPDGNLRWDIPPASESKGASK